MSELDKLLDAAEKRLAEADNHEHQDYSRFKDSLMFSMEMAIIEDKTKEAVMRLIESEELEQLQEARRIIYEHIPQPPNKQFKKYFETHGRY